MLCVMTAVFLAERHLLEENQRSPVLHLDLELPLPSLPWACSSSPRVLPTGSSSLPPARKSGPSVPSTCEHRAAPTRRRSWKVRRLLAGSNPWSHRQDARLLTPSPLPHPAVERGTKTTISSPTPLSQEAQRWGVLPPRTHSWLAGGGAGAGAWYLFLVLGTKACTTSVSPGGEGRGETGEWKVLGAARGSPGTRSVGKTERT